MPQKELCVAFLWHMHQPDYRDIQTGETYLPWTRFHAVKDYHDMASLAQKAGIHLTINVVPSLMDQLVSYGSGNAHETHAALTLKDASILAEHEKIFLLRSFFMLSPKYMVFPYPRYKELWDRRGNPDEQGIYSSGLRNFTTQDYRDLQMWYNLTWCGQDLKGNPEIEQFFVKGRGFTEEEKARLLEIQNSFIGQILPFYGQLADSKTIEISVSPYYHPILPLLCDTRAARESQPSIPLPSDSFIYPQDAKEHIKRSLRVYEEFFGRTAGGMWPSEGALSDAALGEAREAGIRWLASDESVLLNSLQKDHRAGGYLSPEQRFCAYHWGNSPEGPCIFFRDHTLSDLFGFAYQHWPAEEAVEDFFNRLRNIRHSLPDNRHHIVPVILDGENAWEHYPNNGADFLGALYHRLSKSEEFRAVTFSEFLELEKYREPLKSVVAGSWIYGNLATWIGHSEKNRAWELLTAARRFMNSCQSANPGKKQLDLAFHEMMIAEGSDWFWWYGDDHQTDNAAEFDALFRSHLKNVYRYLDETPPTSLDEPIKKTRSIIRLQNPVHTISPQLNGKGGDYFDWLSAGFAIPVGGDSMHRTDRLLEKVLFGFDLSYFYLRLDLTQARGSEFPETGSIGIHFTSPRECSLSLENTGRWSCKILQWPFQDRQPRFAGDKVLELAIPLDALGIRQPEDASLFILVLDNGREIERFPTTGFLTIHINPWTLDQQDWVV
jgi:alpha-amylase/alpha-mannosidase (GH57 family)